MEGDESGEYNCWVAPVEQDFGDFDLDILIGWLCIVMLDMSMHTREPIRDNVLLGPEWVREVLYGHSCRVYEAFRIERYVFLNLCDLMKARGWLEDSQYIRVDEQIGIFLSMICHKNSNRDLCERFRRLGQTISKYFTIVLKAIVKLAKEIIVSPSFDVVPEGILMDPNHKSYFKVLLMAPMFLHLYPVLKQIPFTSKKGITNQNVICVRPFDMKFSFVYAGWEGSANDRRVLSTALETPCLKFSRPPPGKYYLVDSGYAAISGFLTPFKGERYHLSDYRGRSRQPRALKELFNYSHSSLRNVIERSFAALKNRFSILRHMTSFTIRKQAYIVIACCVVHNYIRDQDRRDKNFSLYKDLEDLFGPTQDEVTNDTSTEEGTEMNMLRKSIANIMAKDYNMPEIP